MPNSAVNVAGRNQYRCNGNECTHLHEVKKIYLREVAVGTDSDFPAEHSRSSIVEKSRRTTFDFDAERYGNGYRHNTGSAAIMPANANRRNHNYNNASLSKPNYSNTHNAATNKEAKGHAKEERAQTAINEKGTLTSYQRETDTSRVDSEGNEYTPVPVRQLIQEFEKTCRPVLQYKQISPKVIPIVQQCPLDSDIARFFETRTAVKYNAEEEQRR